MAGVTMAGSDRLAADVPRDPLPLQPGGPLGLRSLLRFTRDPLAFVTSMAQAGGDVVHYRLALRDVFLLRHPELVREVLVTRQHDFAKGEGLRWARRFLGNGLLTSEGEEHTRQRRLAQPAFHRQRIGSYAGVMVAHAAATRDRWREGEELPLDREMVRVTLSIAGKTLFDAETETLAADVGGALTDIMRLFPRFALPFGAILNALPLPSNRRYERGFAPPRIASSDYVIGAFLFMGENVLNSRRSDESGSALPPRVRRAAAPALHRAPRSGEWSTSAE